MQTITINVPDGYEVQIVRKEEKKEPVIRTYQDLIDNSIRLKGFWINQANKIIPYSVRALENYSEDVAISEKVAKSMLAMAQISQLIPYYGGPITDEEWKNDSIKHVIGKYMNDMDVTWHKHEYYFLAFHTNQQRDEFLKYNKQLVKDYLMID